METEQQQKKIVVMNSDIINDKELTPSEKLVYARICFFDEFFEQAEATAEYLGISTDKVKRAKQKLEKLGYIVCVTNTGRGKRYVALLDSLGNSRQVKTTNQTSKKAPIRRVKKTNIDKKEIRTNNIDTNVSMETASQKTFADGKPDFRNDDVQLLVDKWAEITGNPPNSQKWHRIGASHLAKKFGVEVVVKVLYLVRQSYDDQYAPRINDLQDLWKKWGELGAWAHRKQASGKKTLLDETKARGTGIEISPDDL